MAWKTWFGLRATASISAVAEMDGVAKWTVDGRPKGVTEERLTLKRCVGRNVHPASLRGEGISLAVHDGGWQAC